MVFTAPCRGRQLGDPSGAAAQKLTEVSSSLNGISFRQELKNHSILPFNETLYCGNGGSPNWRPLQGVGETIGLQQPTWYTPSASHSLSSSPRGGAKGALRHENRFLSGTSPGGLGNQCIGIMLRASSSGGIAAQKYCIRTILAATLKMLSDRKSTRLNSSHRV